MARVTGTIRVRNHTDGIDRLIANIRDNSEKLAENYANNIVKHIQTFAPIRTGHLRKSASAYKVTATSYFVRVNAYYGVYVNYGTRYMHAQPFMEPAIDYAKAIYEQDKRKVFG